MRTVSQNLDASQAFFSTPTRSVNKKIFATNSTNANSVTMKWRENIIL